MQMLDHFIFLDVAFLTLFTLDWDCNIYITFVSSFRNALWAAVHIAICGGPHGSEN